MKVKYKFKKQIDIINCEKLLKNKLDKYDYFVSFIKDKMYHVHFVFKETLNKKEVDLFDSILSSYQKVDLGIQKFFK